MSLDRARIVSLLKRFTYLQNAVVYEIVGEGELGSSDDAVFYSSADNYEPEREREFKEAWRHAVEHHVRTRTDGVGYRQDPGPAFANTGTFVITQEVAEHLGWAVAGYFYTEQQTPEAKRYETLYRLEQFRYHLVASKARVGGG